MKLLEWHARYSVGDSAIDDEHRQLIEEINRVYAGLRDEVSIGQIHDLLGAVYSAVSAHFALEEALMRRHRYDEYDAHKQDHETLLDEISELDDELGRDPETGVQLLRQRLSGWFSRHFATFDARLHGKLGPD